MTALARPDVRLHESWAAAVLEFGTQQIHGSGSWSLPASLRGDLTRAGCEETVARLLAQGDPDVEPAEGMVHCDHFWVVDEHGGVEEVVGFLALRHTLNAFLLEEGGHVGYAVRPSRRREGHASRALDLAVRRAAELGIERVLVTCDDDNLASRATIERCGGVHEDDRHGKRRYWITAPVTGTTAGGGAGA